MKMRLNLLWCAMTEVLEDITLGNILAMNIYKIGLYNVSHIKFNIVIC